MSATNPALQRVETPKAAPKPQSPLAPIKTFLPIAVMFYRAKLNDYVPPEMQLYLFAGLMILKVRGCCVGAGGAPEVPPVKRRRETTRTRFRGGRERTYFIHIRLIFRALNTRTHVLRLP
jgi:hypothetical protein